MSKLYCEYDNKNPKTEIADHKCDICGKLLCRSCGYEKDGTDYCNDCWKEVDKSSADYPLGGMLEPYDIERDKQL